MNYKFSLTIKWMNYDRPTEKQKKLSRQGRCARKPKRKTNNEQAASFLLCEKMLDLMMGILPPILGNRPPLQGQQGIPCRRLSCACQWVVLEGLAHRARKRRSVDAKYNRRAKRGVRSRTIFNGSREREASQPDTPKPFLCLLPL